MKYIFSFTCCVATLTAVAIYVYPYAAALINPVGGIVVVVALIILIQTLWVSAVGFFDLDNSIAESTNVEKEKLYTIHEYRRLHEIDYDEFSESVRKMLDVRNGIR